MTASTPRAALSPENLGLIEAVARQGSMAAAARELGLVPSALSYRVRQMEEALDVLLFDRSARRAVPTPAGVELLRSGQHLLGELDALAQRVKRVASGWEPQVSIAADALIARAPLFDLCEAFYASGASTRLKLRAETLSGTLQALQSGLADLALGVSSEGLPADIRSAPLGSVSFVYAVAPHHPLAAIAHSLSTEELRWHRAVAVADSTPRGSGVSHHLLPAQEVLTVPSMQHKLQAQLRGLGAGFLPQSLAQPYIDAGRLVVKSVQVPSPAVRVAYAWRQSHHNAKPGRALTWWLQRLQYPGTRLALLNKHIQDG